MEITIEKREKDPINWRERTRQGNEAEYNILGIRLSQNENYVIIKTEEDDEGANTLLFENLPFEESESVPTGIRVINACARYLGKFGEKIDVENLLEQMDLDKSPKLTISHLDAKGRLFVIC